MNPATIEVAQAKVIIPCTVYTQKSRTGSMDALEGKLKIQARKALIGGRNFNFEHQAWSFSIHRVLITPPRGALCHFYRAVQ